MVTPQGTIAYPLGTGYNFYAQGMGDLVTAPDGSVLALNESSAVRLSPQGEQTVYSFPQSAHQTFLGVSGFLPDGIAVATRRHDLRRHLLGKRLCRGVGHRRHRSERPADPFVERRGSVLQIGVSAATTRGERSKADDRYGRSLDGHAVLRLSCR